MALSEQELSEDVRRSARRVDRQRMVKTSRGLPGVTPGSGLRSVEYVCRIIGQPLYVAYRCRGILKINVGHTQQRRPGPMPFDIGGLGNAKVGRDTAKLL